MNQKQITLILFCFILVPLFSFSNGNEDANYHFTENKGQLNQNVKYHCKIHIGDIFFETNQFTFDLFSAKDFDLFYNVRHDKKLRDLYGRTPLILGKHSYNMQFVNANENCTITGSEKEDYYKNYIRGNDPNNWQSNVSSFGKITYQSLYPNIDMKVYGLDNNLKYDFIVKVGGNPADILINYNDVNGLTLNDGTLEIDVSTGMVKELKPIAYQYIEGEKTMVQCNFVLNDQLVNFEFPEGFDSNYELIIDPIWVFSTLTGSTADNWGFTATYDDNTNFYGGGIAFGNGYPTSAGSYSVSFGGNVDAVITKYNPGGTDIVYSTYIGGTDADQPHSLITDADSNLVILGVTASNNFPSTAGAYDESFNGGTADFVDGIAYDGGLDIFVLKLNNTGTALIGSTFLGGSYNDGFSLDNSLNFNYADHARGEVVLGPNNEVYIASCTTSNDFPTTASSYSQTSFGGFDGVVTKLSSDLTNMEWSTYVGGSGGDAAYSLRVDEVNDKVFICGGTTSSNLGTTAGVYADSYFGSTDGFIAKFNDSDGSLDAMTYIGTTSYDQSYMIDLDDDQEVYVVGQTKGSYPVSDDVYSNESSTQFIHKLNTELTTSELSTVFGTTDNLFQVDISITAFLVDNCNNVYVGGWGGTTNNEGTTNGMPITADAIQSSTDGSDFYFIVLEQNFQNLLYGTYFGSSGVGEHVDGGTSRFDKRGSIYEGVCAACGGSSFPTSPNAYSSINGSSNCNFGAIKIDLEFQGVQASVIPPSDQTFCDPPYDIDFAIGEPAPPNNFWDFGDGIGTATDDNTPSYTYQNPGNYTITYIAIDENSCIPYDTLYFDLNITQLPGMLATMNYSAPPPCESDTLLVELEFTGSGADQIEWDMGDGTVINNDFNVNYIYENFGSYNITMTVNNLECELEEIIINPVSFINPLTIEGIIPNVFTPNNDGSNDKLKFTGIDNAKDFSLKIFNRWGNLVYENTNPQQYWDGGESLEGVYYYILKYTKICTTDEKVVSGTVSLLK